MLVEGIYIKFFRSISCDILLIWLKHILPMYGRNEKLDINSHFLLLHLKKIILLNCMLKFYKFNNWQLYQYVPASLVFLKKKKKKQNIWLKKNKKCLIQSFGYKLSYFLKQRKHRKHTRWPRWTRFTSIANRPLKIQGEKKMRKKFYVNKHPNHNSFIFKSKLRFFFLHNEK